MPRPAEGLAAAGLAALLAVVPACRAPVPAPSPDSAGGEGVAASLRPDACRAVAAGTPLQPLLDAAGEGDAFCLEAGDHAGPLRVRRSLTLWGPAEAWIRSRGVGSTVSLEAPGTALLGLSIDGSGGRFDLLDAAVHIRADDARVEGVRVRRALFGLLAERSRRITLRHNDVGGDPAKPLGLRGDGIRIWEVRDSLIEGNRLHDSRDLVVWYSSANRILDNTIERGRYGTHFMYSHDNIVERNRYTANVVGVFAMYSRGLRLRANVIALSAGAAGIGLGAKESGALEVVGNHFLANTTGVYLDTSPFHPGDGNRFEGNEFRFGGTAVVFHGVTDRNHFLGNSFRDNREQVRTEGRGDARAAEWRRNDFDDYVGYDLDGDGTGDVAYELRSLEGALTARAPSVAFFRGSAALGLMELIGKVVPLFRPQIILVDPEPSMVTLKRRVSTEPGDAG